MPLLLKLLRLSLLSNKIYKIIVATIQCSKDDCNHNKGFGSPIIVEDDGGNEMNKDTRKRNIMIRFYL